MVGGISLLFVIFISLPSLIPKDGEKGRTKGKDEGRKNKGRLKGKGGGKENRVHAISIPGPYQYHI